MAKSEGATGYANVELSAAAPSATWSNDGAYGRDVTFACASARSLLSALLPPVLKVTHKAGANTVYEQTVSLGGAHSWWCLTGQRFCAPLLPLDTLTFELIANASTVDVHFQFSEF